MECNLNALIKISKEKYMNNFYEKGEIFLNRLKSFRNDNNIERRDEFEGMSHFYNLSRFTMNINGKNLNFSNNDGFASIDYYSQEINPFNYSMYALSTKHHKLEQGNLIDKRVLELGDTAVIIDDINKFYERLKKYCIENKLIAKAQPVEYINFNKYEGKSNLFYKCDDYDYQHEWRLLINKVTIDNSLKIEIGSLKDIAYIVPSKEINKIIKLQ